MYLSLMENSMNDYEEQEGELSLLNQLPLKMQECTHVCLEIKLV